MHRFLPRISAQRLLLTTIAYNLENLESVGLVKVEGIKYSEKGRKVKIYAPVRKLIVVVPEKTDRRSVADLLRKYLGVILAAVLASSLIELFTKRGKMGNVNGNKRDPFCFSWWRYIKDHKILPPY